MSEASLSGLIVPPVTPFDENNAIDEPALAAHLHFLSEGGVTRLLVNGTTAEFFSLLPEERLTLLKITRRHFKGLLFFNTASDSLKQAVRSAKEAEGEGADAIVAMTPYYLAGAPPEGLIRFFNELGKSVSIPMVLYNFTKHTGNPLTPEILKEVEHAGVKDSSGDYSLIAATKNYLAGSSRKMVEGAQAGAAGFVSSLANILPKPYVELEEALKSNELKGAETLQQEIMAKTAHIPSDNEIPAIKKEAARLVANYPLRVRLPLLF